MKDLLLSDSFISKGTMAELFQHGCLKGTLFQRACFHSWILTLNLNLRVQKYS